MIIYNVTCNVERAVESEWLQWMMQEHIPEVMASGCFVDFKVMKLLTQADDDTGVNYAVQYRARNMDDYDHYRVTFAPGLQKKTASRYGEQVMAFRSLLEEVK